MGLGRRGKRVDEDSAWVFNRMADWYDARPPYPHALLDALHEIMKSDRPRVLDLGAGIGHLALPLAQLGARVTAIEPARTMLQRLRQSALRDALAVNGIHASAESLPLPADSIDLAVIADALHFLDAELTAVELMRVLSPRGVLCVIRSELAETPYMKQVVRIMEESAPRRPRETGYAVTQIGAMLGVVWEPPRVFDDETPMEHDRVEQILRTISFIGPAMNPDRFAIFSRRIREIPEAPVWARRMTVNVGRRPVRAPRS